MAERTRPLKPRRNPVHIAFPRTGAVRVVVEELPRTQDSLEIALGRKFVGALSQFFGVELLDLAPGEEPSDLTCHARSETIRIQVVEVINQQWRELDQMRNSYREALSRALASRSGCFSGCRVTLIDSVEPPYLPSVSSREGQACLDNICADLNRINSEILTLESGRLRVRRIQITVPGRHLVVQVQRLLSPGPDVSWDLRWSGGYPPASLGLLSAAVQQKIEKRYAKPEGGRFWLLAYSTDTFLTKEDPAISEAAQRLEHQAHPFDEAWYMFPYADEDLGHLLRVWSKDQD